MVKRAIIRPVEENLLLNHQNVSMRAASLLRVGIEKRRAFHLIGVILDLVLEYPGCLDALFLVVLLCNVAIPALYLAMTLLYRWISPRLPLPPLQSLLGNEM